MTSQPLQVLLVENNRSDAKRVKKLLRARGPDAFRLRRVRRLRDAQHILHTGRIDVVLLDLNLPDASGLDAVRQAHRAGPNVAILLLSDVADDALAAQALREGAQDFLVKAGLCEGPLLRCLSFAVARQQARDSLHVRSLVDELTGLYNRRGFLTLAEQQLKMSQRRGLKSSLVFVDLDDLKMINDNFGHNEGDYALQQIARIFRACFRESDIVARLGGDEFSALLSDASQSSKDVISKRLAGLIEEHNATGDRRYRLSVSMGIVEISSPSPLAQQIACADALMYRQKRHKQSGLQSNRRSSIGDSEAHPGVSSQIAIHKNT